MTAERHIGPLRLLPTYQQRAIIKSMFNKLHQDSFNIKGLVCITTGRRTDKRTDGRTNGRTNRRTDGQTDGQTDERTDRWTDARTDGQF